MIHDLTGLIHTVATVLMSDSTDIAP